MYLPPKLLVTSGVNTTPCDWLNKGYSFCMAAVVVIGDGRGLRIEMCCRNQPNKSKLLLYKLLFFTLTFLLNGCTCTQATR